MVKKKVHYANPDKTHYFRPGFSRRTRGTSKKYPTIDTLPDNFGIVVVDMQKEFLSTHNPDWVERMVRAQRGVLKTASELDYPIILVEYGGYGETISEITSMARMAPRHRIVKKNTSDGFNTTNLRESLREFGVECIGFMGVYATACVQATANTANNLGIDFIVSDMLMSDSVGHDGSRGDRSNISPWGVEWYKKNALAYFASHRDLISLMKAKA